MPGTGLSFDPYGILVSTAFVSGMMAIPRRCSYAGCTCEFPIEMLPPAGSFASWTSQAKPSTSRCPSGSIKMCERL